MSQKARLIILSSLAGAVLLCLSIVFSAGSTQAAPPILAQATPAPGCPVEVDPLERLHESPVVQVFLLMDESQSLQQYARTVEGQVLDRRLSELNRAAAGFLISYLNAVHTSIRYEIGFVQFGSDPANQIFVQSPRLSNDPSVKGFLFLQPRELNYTEFSQAFMATTDWLLQDLPTIYILFTDGESAPSPFYGENRGQSEAQLILKDWDKLIRFFSTTLEPRNAHVYVLIQPADPGDQDSVARIMGNWRHLLAETRISGDVKLLTKGYYSFADLYAEILGSVADMPSSLTQHDFPSTQPVRLALGLQSARFVFFRQDPRTTIRLWRPDGSEELPAVSDAHDDYSVIFDIQGPVYGDWRVEATNNTRLYLYQTYPTIQVLAPGRAVDINEPLHIVARTDSTILGTSPLWDARLVGPGGEQTFIITRSTMVTGSDGAFVYETWLEPSALVAEGRYELALTSRAAPDRVAGTYAFCAHPTPRLVDIDIQQGMAYLGERSEVTVSVRTQSSDKAPGLVPQVTILRDGQVVAGPLPVSPNPGEAGLHMAQVHLNVGTYQVLVSFPAGETVDGIPYPKAEIRTPLSVAPIGPVQIGAFDISPREVVVGEPFQVSAKVHGLSALREASMTMTVTSMNGQPVYTATVPLHGSAGTFTHTFVLTRTGGYQIGVMLSGRAPDGRTITPVSSEIVRISVTQAPMTLRQTLGIPFVRFLVAIIALMALGYLVAFVSWRVGWSKVTAWPLAGLCVIYLRILAIERKRSLTETETTKSREYEEKLYKTLARKAHIAVVLFKLGQGDPDLFCEIAGPDLGKVPKLAAAVFTRLEPSASVWWTRLLVEWLSHHHIESVSENIQTYLHHFGPVNGLFMIRRGPRRDKHLGPTDPYMLVTKDFAGLRDELKKRSPSPSNIRAIEIFCEFLQLLGQGHSDSSPFERQMLLQNLYDKCGNPHQQEVLDQQEVLGWFRRIYDLDSPIFSKAKEELRQEALNVLGDWDEVAAKWYQENLSKLGKCEVEPPRPDEGQHSTFYPIILDLVYLNNCLVAKENKALNLICIPAHRESIYSLLVYLDREVPGTQFWLKWSLVSCDNSPEGERWGPALKAPCAVMLYMRKRPVHQPGIREIFLYPSSPSRDTLEYDKLTPVYFYTADRADHLNVQFAEKGYAAITLHAARLVEPAECSIQNECGRQKCKARECSTVWFCNDDQDNQRINTGLRNNPSVYLQLEGEYFYSKEKKGSEGKKMFYGRHKIPPYWIEIEP